ncbi:MAG: hypothetical protein FGM46_06815 [Ferruginibacter sp.]|nr:hypothetical protein [Ferruginibacter sp.]
MKSFSTEDLLEFLYKECDSEKMEAIESALSDNPDLNQEFLQIKEVQSTLNDVNYSPSKKSVDLILEYAMNSEMQ